VVALIFKIAGQDDLEFTQSPSKHFIGADEGQIAISQVALALGFIHFPERQRNGASEKHPFSLGH